MTVEEVLTGWRSMGSAQRIESGRWLVVFLTSNATRSRRWTLDERGQLSRCLHEGADEALRSGDVELEARLLDAGLSLGLLDEDRIDRLAARWCSLGRGDLRAAMVYIQALGHGLAAGTSQAERMRDLILEAAKANPKRSALLLRAMDAYGIGDR